MLMTLDRQGRESHLQITKRVLDKCRQERIERIRVGTLQVVVAGVGQQPPEQEGPREVIHRVGRAGDGASHHFRIKVLRQLQLAMR